MDASAELPVSIRTFRPDDSAACRALYREGLLGNGRLAENDTGSDIDDIQSAYMRNDGNRFFVAVDEQDRVVGMVGVAHHEESTGEIRRLRVARDCQRPRGIGSKLVEAALKYCTERNFLKVTLDTFMDREPAVRLFEKFQFRHHRSRTVNDRELLYFYLDLYAGNGRKP